LNTQKKYSSSVKVFFPKFNTEEVIKELSKCATELREKLGLEKVILFGSYAKENYTVASDIDLLIIFNDKKAAKTKFTKA
jgi:predicted nucleotidyltransferase